MTWLPAPAALQSACFLLESLAQAAGWLIAASTGFGRRGLPLSIDTVQLVADPRPGAPAVLHAEVAAWRDGSAIIRAQARCGRTLLAAVEGGICALVEAEQLEDPAATRATYEGLLRNGGKVRCGAGTAEPPGAPAIEAADGRRGRGTWVVAGGSGLFADHFPRLPLLPGSLQVQALVELARAVGAAGGGPAGPPTRLGQVRFRRPVRPGDRLLLDVETVERTPARLMLSGRAWVGDERAASIGQIQIGGEP